MTVGSPEPAPCGCGSGERTAPAPVADANERPTMKTIDLKTILKAMPANAFAILRPHCPTVDKLVRQLCICYTMLPSSPRAVQFSEDDHNRLCGEVLALKCGRGDKQTWDKILGAYLSQPEPVTSDHAPEPWHDAGFSAGNAPAAAFIKDATMRSVAHVFSGGGVDCHATQRRIIACVNAMAGVPDPAAELARLRYDLEFAKAAAAERQKVSFRLADELTTATKELARRREQEAGAVRVPALLKALEDACPTLYSMGQGLRVTEVDRQTAMAAFAQARGAIAAWKEAQQ